MEDEAATKPPSSKKKKKSAKKAYAKSQKKKTDRLAEIANQNLEVGGCSGAKVAKKKKQKHIDNIPPPQMTEIDEANLLQTPVGRHEPPEVLEARRQALMRQQQQLYRSRESLLKAQATIKVKQEEIEEYECGNRSAIRPIKIPGVGNPEDLPVKRRLENPAWQKQLNSVNAKGERIYKTTAENAEASFAILNDDLYSRDEKL